MGIITLEEIIEELKENIESELDSSGLDQWALNASGMDLKESFDEYSTEDLQELKQNIMEGLNIEVTIELTGPALQCIKEILVDRSEQDIYDEDDDEVESHYEDDDE